MLQQCKVDGGLPGSFPKEALACGTGKPRLAAAHTAQGIDGDENFSGVSVGMWYMKVSHYFIDRDSLFFIFSTFSFFFPLPHFLYSFPVFFPYPLLLFFPFYFPSLCFLWRGNYLNLFWIETICNYLTDIRGACKSGVKGQEFYTSYGVN